MSESYGVEMVLGPVVLPYTNEPECPACGGYSYGLRDYWRLVVLGMRMANVDVAFCVGNRPPTDTVRFPVGGGILGLPRHEETREVMFACAGIGASAPACALPFVLRRLVDGNKNSDWRGTMENELGILPQFHAVAVNATEMKTAHDNIRTWLEAKVAGLQSEVETTYAALDVATRNGWKPDALRNLFNRDRQKLLYYGKLLTAVKAGYTIVPNMDIDVFAIRVKRARPAEDSQTRESAYGFPQVDLNHEEEQHLQIGEGRYESPVQMVTTKTFKREIEKDKHQYTTTVTPVGFADLEFPMAVAHPMVMDATAQAMTLKLFDRIGVVSNAQERDGDPIILGQITRKQGFGFRRASFLIAWYLDPRTL